VLTLTKESRRAVWVVVRVWATATLLEALILAAQERLYFPYAIAGSATYFGLLGVLSWPVWSVCARIAERSYSRIRVVGIHLLMGVVVLALWQGAYLACMRVLAGSLAGLRLRETGLWQLLGTATFYAAMIAGVIAVQTSRRLQIQLRRQAELRLLAREAELRALRAQIRPHFFFNVMNSIYALIESRPRQAQEMVELVADLMRQTLDASEQDFVSLAWELQAVETYLRIEKIRLGDRLRIRVERNADTAECAVPPFLLQPLVENAVKHGVAPMPGQGEVEVSTRIAAGRLELTVRDTGRGCETAGTGEEREGRGLSITRRRLENLYGEGFSITQRNVEPAGWEVRICIPRQGLQSASAMSHG
jgi:two-component system LytT family sensor kinase